MHLLTKSNSEYIDKKVKVVIENSINTQIVEDPSVSKGIIYTIATELRLPFEIGEGKVVPLDNTITNAVLLALLALRVENLGDDCKDIMAIFTIGEERKSERGFKEPKGIKNFMEKFSSHLKDDVKFINLDVTANEYHYYKKDQNIAALIEYHESLNSNKIDKLYKYSKLDIFDEIGLGDDIMFCDYSDEEGTSDDLEEIVLYEDVFGFTLGLNTYGTIHSVKNRTTVRNINSYFNQLNKFFDSEFFRPNFR